MKNLILLIVSLSLIAVAMFSQTRKQSVVSALDDQSQAPPSCQCGSGCGCGCQQTGSCSCSK